MPCSAGLRPSSPGTKTDSVFPEPALMMSKADTATKMVISIRPRITPVRVEIEIPR